MNHSFIHSFVPPTTPELGSSMSSVPRAPDERSTVSRRGPDKDTRVRTLSTGGPQPGQQHPEEIWAEGGLEGQLKVKGVGEWRTFQAELSRQPGKPREQSVGLPTSRQPLEGVASRCGRCLLGREVATRARWAGGARCDEGPFGSSSWFMKVIMVRLFISSRGSDV